MGDVHVDSGVGNTSPLTQSLEADVVKDILTSDPANVPLPKEHLASLSTPRSNTSATPHPRQAVVQSAAHAKPLPPPLRIPGRGKSNSISIAGPPPAEFRHHRKGAASLSQVPTGLSLVIPQADADSSPSDNEFLTALAGQERRVLELREELHKAEQYLLTLKKQWASQEATRRRNPVQRLQPMREISAITTPVNTQDDEEGSSDWISHEMERRKNILTKTNRRGHRRVFSGSREIRPLKLVSPSTKRLSAPSLPSTDLEAENEDSPSTHRPRHPTRVARSSTMPDFGEPIPEEASERSVYDGDVLPGALRSHHVRKSTQIVSDFREGLWTFFEDLRQATVGEEARPGPAPQREINGHTHSTKDKKRLSPRTNRKSPRGSSGSDKSPRPHDDATLIDIGGAFWKDHGLENQGDGLETPQKRPIAASQSSGRKSKASREIALHTRFFDGEAWDTWDTPEKTSPANPYSSSAASPAQNSTSTRDGSSRNSSQSSVGHALTTPSQLSAAQPAPLTDSDGIPWPAFTKRASMLRSSAMHLMDEWERSLNPPESHKAMDTGSAAGRES